MYHTAQVLRMFWLDAHEDPYKQPGTVWLFGKVRVEAGWVSCCLTVRNISRRVFLAKREFRTNTKTGAVDQSKPVGGCCMCMLVCCTLFCIVFHIYR